MIFEKIIIFEKSNNMEIRTITSFLGKAAVIVAAVVFAARAEAKGIIVKSEWGISAGLRYNALSVKNGPAGLSMRPGLTYNAGLHAAIAFVGIGIQPELNYGYTTATLTLTDASASKVKVKAHDLEVPVLLSLRFLPVVRFNVGPVFNIMSSANYKVDGEKLLLGGLHPHIGYAVGLALGFGKVVIDARFTGYFKRTDNEFNPAPKVPDSMVPFKVKTCSGGLKIGFLF